MFDYLTGLVEESSAEEAKAGKNRGCYLKTFAEKAQEERNFLLIHGYRDELLKLIEENRVLEEAQSVERSVALSLGELRQ